MTESFVLVRPPSWSEREPVSTRMSSCAVSIIHTKIGKGPLVPTQGMDQAEASPMTRAPFEKDSPEVKSSGCQPKNFHL